MIVALLFAAILFLAGAVYVVLARRKPKRRPPARYFSYTFAAGDQIDLKPAEKDQLA